MFDLKRCAIKMASNINVLESKRGKVFLKNDLIMKGLLKNKKYESITIKILFQIDGIRNIYFDYENMKTIIIYDDEKISENAIVKYLKFIIELIIYNYKDIKNIFYGNNEELFLDFIKLSLIKEDINYNIE